MGHAFLECPAEIPFEMIFDLRTSLPSQEIGNSTMWYDWHIHITFIRSGVFAKMYHLCASVGLCGKQQALTPVDIFETPNLFVCFLMQFMQLWPNPTKPAILSFALLCLLNWCASCASCAKARNSRDSHFPCTVPAWFDSFGSEGRENMKHS